MKRILMAGAMILAASVQVVAADLPQAVPPGAPPESYFPRTAPYYNWAGLYFGINGGYAFGTSNWSDPNNPFAASTGNFGTSGGVVGGTIGANFRAGQIVFGPEGDFDYSTIRGSTAPASGFCTLINGAGLTATNCQTQNTWLGTFRARLGYAVDRVLFYGTGGLALGNIHAGLTGGGITPSYDSSVGVGWTAGGGLEFALGEHWTGRLEYLYVSLAHGSCTSTNCGIDGINFTTFATVTANDSVKFNTNIVRVGINYKFYWE